MILFSLSHIELMLMYTYKQFLEIDFSKYMKFIFMYNKLYNYN